MILIWKITKPGLSGMRFKPRQTIPPFFWMRISQAQHQLVDLLLFGISQYSSAVSLLWSALPLCSLSSDLLLTFLSSLDSLATRPSSLAACRLSKVPCLSCSIAGEAFSLRRFFQTCMMPSRHANLISVVQAYIPIGTANTMAKTITTIWMSFALCSISVMSLPVTNIMHCSGRGGLFLRVTQISYLVAGIRSETE